MSKLLWFAVGLVVGETWRALLIHVLYLSIIVWLLLSGHYPFHCSV